MKRGPAVFPGLPKEKTVRYYDYGSAAPRGRLKPEFARGLGERRGVDPYCAQEHSGSHCTHCGSAEEKRRPASGRLSVTIS
jgi:hypothetical protein